MDAHHHDPRFEPIRSRHGDGWRVEAYSFQPGLRLPPHAHEAASFNLTLSGNVLDARRKGELDLGVMRATSNPCGFEHAVKVGPQGALVLHVELDQPETNIAGQDRMLSPDEESSWLLLKLFAELQLDDEFSADGMDELADALNAPGGARPLPRSWMAAVLEELREARPARPDLERLAAAAGVHPGHVSRSFRQHTGHTLVDHLRRLRLERACELMADDRATLAEVAQDAGFSDQAHMTRCFRSRLRITPGRYRDALGSAAGAASG